jgi:hypothetical protein
VADSRAVTTGLFVTLGLVGAFIVSAIAAGRGEDGTEADALALPEPDSVAVEVLNGAGRPGLARNATETLRAAGFDVVFYGNASRFDHGRSTVLDRVGDPVRARAVAHALGIDSVATAVDSSLLLDVSVVLGSDWPDVEEPPAGALDRVRRLLAPDTAGETDGRDGSL